MISVIKLGSSVSYLKIILMSCLLSSD